MRVLLVSEPGVDGVFRHVEALAHFLRGQKHAVDLAFSDVRGSDRLKELVRCIESWGGRTLNLAVGNAPGPGDLRALFRLRGLVSERRPDVIHGHSSKAGGLVRLLPLAGVRSPLFYTPHAYYGMSGGRGLKSFVYSTIERLLGRSGTSITLSEGERDFANAKLRVPGPKLRLIPNPVDTVRFVPGAGGKRERLQGELGLPPGTLLLGAVGRLAFQKDPLTLYRSFALALKRVPSLWLYHLGTGELSAQCEVLARELGIGGRVIRRPYLSEPLSFYQSIDAMILTSRYEGLSFAVLEALACDLPVILSDAPGNRDFLKMGLSHAWSGPVESVEGFSTAIASWAADRADHRECNHRAVAEMRFSQEACFGALVREYESALAR